MEFPEVLTMDSSLLDDAGDSLLPCDVGTELFFPTTFTSPASYLVTTFRLYSTFCIAFMVSQQEQLRQQLDTATTYNLHSPSCTESLMDWTCTDIPNRPLWAMFQHTSPFCVTWRLHFASFASALCWQFILYRVAQKTGPPSHCKYSENSMTIKLHGN